MKRIYFDNSATTQVDERVLNEMNKIQKEIYGNPSSLHSFGIDAFEVKEKAREKIAEILNCKSNELYFTSGGTESNNTALKGMMNSENSKGKKLITSKIEHPSVLRTAEHLRSKGKEVSFVSVDEKGLIDLNKLEKEINSNTALVSVMHANNEIGTIEPIEEIAELCESKNALFHSDMVQTLGKMKIDLRKLNISLASFSGHKIYAPKGNGVLFVKEGIKPEQLIHGGGQERNLRSGTENIAGIIGFAKAMDLVHENLDEEMLMQKKLRDKLIKGLSEIKKSRLNGDEIKRLPNNVNFSFYGIEGESMVALLDGKGIAGSTGSACSSKELKISHVLEAIGLNHVWAHGSLRLSLGKNNNEKEINYALEVIPEIVEKLRKISAVKV
ncbi:MAG: cysteine desulfurase family protein [Candidatus Diapherotrites archaeon]